MSDTAIHVRWIISATTQRDYDKCGNVHAKRIRIERIISARKYDTADDSREVHSPRISAVIQSQELKRDSCM